MLTGSRHSADIHQQAVQNVDSSLCLAEDNEGKWGLQQMKTMQSTNE